MCFDKEDFKFERRCDDLKKKEMIKKRTRSKECMSTKGHRIPQIVAIYRKQGPVWF